jgi:hypothetical protein
MSNLLIEVNGKLSERAIPVGVARPQVDRWEIEGRFLGQIKVTVQPVCHSARNLFEYLHQVNAFHPLVI